MIDIVHIRENVTRVIERDPATMERINAVEDRLQKHYIVGIGWHGTYISRWGARPYLVGFSTMQRNRRREIREEAERAGDEITEWRTCIASNRRDVVRFYAV